MKKCILTIVILIGVSEAYEASAQWTTSTPLYTNPLLTNGVVGIGANSPFYGTNNTGLHVAYGGGHASILLGDPIGSSHGGIVQTSDGRHRIFIGANAYDDGSMGWRNFQAGKGVAGISLLADNGNWGNVIDFYVNNGDALVSRMSIWGNGNVGIGTTAAPAARLEVSSSGPAEGSIRINADPGQQSSLYFYKTGSTANMVVYRPPNSNDLRIWGGAVSADIITFQNSNARVGIGTIAPNAKLEVAAVGQESAIRINADDNQQTALYFYKNGSTVSNAIYRPSGSTDLRIWGSTYGDAVTFKNDGKVGISNNSPETYLHIGTSNMGWGRTVRMILEPPQHTGAGWEFAVRDEPGNSFLSIGYGAERFTIQHEGRVGIGTTNPDKELTVKGTIHTHEVLVDAAANVMPDYVFEKDYELLSLAELEIYINANKHLPEVPSAKEAEENGLNLKEMNLLLLKKVEELTLHLIEQNKAYQELKGQVGDLQRQIVEQSKNKK